MLLTVAFGGLKVAQKRFRKYSHVCKPAHEYRPHPKEETQKPAAGSRWEGPVFGSRWSSKPATSSRVQTTISGHGRKPLAPTASSAQSAHVPESNSWIGKMSQVHSTGQLCDRRPGPDMRLVDQYPKEWSDESAFAARGPPLAAETNCPWKASPLTGRSG